MTITQSATTVLIFHVDHLSRGSASSMLSLLWKIMNARGCSFYYEYERIYNQGILVNYNIFEISNIFYIFSSTFYV